MQVSDFGVAYLLNETREQARFLCRLGCTCFVNSIISLRSELLNLERNSYPVMRTVFL